MIAAAVILLSIVLLYCRIRYYVVRNQTDKWSAMDFDELAIRRLATKMECYKATVEP
jgi:hypothetical protein